MQTKTILIIDDDAEAADLVALSLANAGYRYLVASDGISGLEAVRRNKPDLVLIALMLPGLSGVEVCKRLKSDVKTAGIPIVVMTTRGDEIYRIVSFEIGADDCVVKPFSVKELLLRMKAILRCAGQTARGVINVGPISVDAERHIVAVDREEVTLTTTEYKILFTMVERLGGVLSRDKLMERACSITDAGSGRTIDTHIARIRTKLGRAGDLIKTVRNRGYRIEQAEGNYDMPKM